MREDRSREEAWHGDAALALQPTGEYLEPTPALVHDSKPDLVTTFHAVSRQLANVNIALTALQSASERSATTALMLEGFNREWDVLDARPAALARAAVGIGAMAELDDQRAAELAQPGERLAGLT